MKRSWMIVLAVVAGALVVFLVGRRRREERRELAFREELETLPSLSS